MTIRRKEQTMVQDHRGALVQTLTTGRQDNEPVPPAEPDVADCCGEGCVRCVFDVYEQALEKYQLALATWRDRHA